MIQRKERRCPPIAKLDYILIAVFAILLGLLIAQAREIGELAEEVQDVKAQIEALKETPPTELQSVSGKENISHIF